MKSNFILLLLLIGVLLCLPLAHAVLVEQQDSDPLISTSTDVQVNATETKLLREDGRVLLSNDTTTAPTSGPSTNVTATAPASGPTTNPSSLSSDGPSSEPSPEPSDESTIPPSNESSSEPSNKPSNKPSSEPSTVPSSEPTVHSSTGPTEVPSVRPSVVSSITPSHVSSNEPTETSSGQPSVSPTGTDSDEDNDDTRGVQVPDDNDDIDDDDDDDDEGSPLDGRQGLCIIGCTPYVRWDNEWSGKRKYMASDCDILVHVGDTKAGSERCTDDSLTRAVHALREAGEAHDKIVLYAPGDNEINDCHRRASKYNNPQSDRIYKASDARSVLISNLGLDQYLPINATTSTSSSNGTSTSTTTTTTTTSIPTTLSNDLTGKYGIVRRHVKYGKIPLPTTIPDTPWYGMTENELPDYHCDFDTYVETSSSSSSSSHFAVITLEVIGSHWYLDDERLNGYPYQNEIDPLHERLELYINAKDCAVEWIEQSAARADDSNVRALFITFHAAFYSLSGTRAYTNGGLGEYYGGANLQDYTGIRDPYQPLFDTIYDVAYQHPNIMFYIVNADGHRSINLRLFPDKTNYVDTSTDQIFLRSHQNVMIHQVEGASRGLTMYSKFTVDTSKFQPITLKEEWSRSAFNTYPEGHVYDPY